MKVVHISYLYGVNNTGGAAIAATRLHKCLLDMGIESHYVCHYAKEEGRNVHVLPPSKVLRFIHYILGKATRFAWHFTGYGHSLETNIVPLFGVERLINDIDPDLVHIHWLNRGVISFEQLSKINSPVVLHLHDLFMMNVLLPHPGDDNRYISGLTKQNSNWWERWVFERKRKAILKIHPTIIGPSRWICNCAKASIIGRDCLVAQVPNIIDNIYYEMDSDISLPDKFIILFGANGGRNSTYKGYDDLVKSLSLVSRNVSINAELWIFGEASPDMKIGDLPVHFCGIVNDAKTLKAIYAQSAIFVLPSKLDNAPSTKFEAWLCGLPVVAFNRAGCAESIEHTKNGWIAGDGDIKAYARGIEFFFERFKDGSLLSIRQNIIDMSRKEYSIANAIGSIRKVYEEMTINVK